MKRALLLGCGYSRERKIRMSLDESKDFEDFDLVTIDMDPNCKPSFIHDLTEGTPFLTTEQFDEIHAYDSLEHWGNQGDWQGWINEMEEYHDLLVPSGRFVAIVPVGEDRFTDPGHVRFFGTNWFNILCNDYYEEMAAKGIPTGDYRWYWKKNFKRIGMDFMRGPDGVPHHLAVVLEKA